VLYAVGENTRANAKPAWRRHKALVSGDTLRIATTFNASYTLEAHDLLRGTWQRGEGQALALAKMSKVNLADLLNGRGAPVSWGASDPEFPLLETSLREDGRPVLLEAVIYKPKGDGPFPLFVFNHGSTATGRDAQSIRETWSSFTLADYFVAKGWMVAFPQRRGRGRSDGLYDEGLAPDRRQGYSCDPVRSLMGAERALDDIAAAIDALRRRSDVDGGRILIGGQSRGGVLSIEYAARHPEQVLGVINFAGGWLAEACSTATAVNRSLFRRGGGFGGETLWLYGKADTFYSLTHSRSNFEAFRAAGGKGVFMTFGVPAGANGHLLMTWPDVWGQAVGRYLRALRSGNER
jgi:dienelactone hydrolase